MEKINQLYEHLHYPALVQIAKSLHSQINDGGSDDVIAFRHNSLIACLQHIIDNFEFYGPEISNMFIQFGITEKK